MAAPFLPPASPPTAAPRAMIAAVRALRPKRERFLVCPDASSDKLLTRNRRLSRPTETFRMLRLLPLASIKPGLERERRITRLPSANTIPLGRPAQVKEN